MDRLKGRVIVITGATGDVGSALCARAAAYGARLFLVGRDATKLSTLAAHYESKWLACDLSAAGACEEVVSGAFAAFGQVDGLVNNAGTFVWKPFVEMSRTAWDTSMFLHATAPFLLSQELTKRWVTAKTAGAIVNISSIHAQVGQGQAVAQCASKAALLGLTRAVAEAVRSFGIRVNAICPGAIAADSAETSGRVGDKITQRDVAELCMFLLSPASGAITGEVFGASGATRAVISS